LPRTLTSWRENRDTMASKIEDPKPCFVALLCRALRITRYMHCALDLLPALTTSSNLDTSFLKFHCSRPQTQKICVETPHFPRPVAYSKPFCLTSSYHEVPSRCPLRSSRIRLRGQPPAFGTCFSRPTQRFDRRILMGQDINARGTTVATLALRDCFSSVVGLLLIPFRWDRFPSVTGALTASMDWTRPSRGRTAPARVTWTSRTV
jgi:hypothetical protein